MALAQAYELEQHFLQYTWQEAEATWWAMSAVQQRAWSTKYAGTVQKQLGLARYLDLAMHQAGLAWTAMTEVERQTWVDSHPASGAMLDHT